MAEFPPYKEKKVFTQEFERVPPCYKEVEKVLQKVRACQGSFKTVMNSSRLRGSMFKKVYSLAVNVLKNWHILEKIIEKTDLLKILPFLRKEFAGVLVYEMVLGKGLPGESKPVIALRECEKEIREAYNIVKKDASISTALQSLPRYARVNTLITSVSAVLEDLKYNGFQQISYDKNISLDGYINLVTNLQVGYFMVDFHFKDLLVFSTKEKLPSMHLHQKGHIFIQDKSSYIPVYALNPKPGGTVLDACAAPGMKTLHIAATMKNEGKIYAYEKDEQRFSTLKSSLEFGNITICEAECEDFYLVNSSHPKFRSVEYILVDPSCSGSGMVNRMDSVTDTKDSKNEQRLQKLAGFQILLLKHALLFPSVKRVVYSTCSINEEENEFVVHEVLNKYRFAFKLVPVMQEWPIRGSSNYEYGHLCLRANSKESLTNGFFVAMFEKLENNVYQDYPLCESIKSNSYQLVKSKNKKSIKDKTVEVSNARQNEGEISESPLRINNFYHCEDSSNAAQTSECDQVTNKIKKHKKKHKSRDFETKLIDSSSNVSERAMKIEVEEYVSESTETKGQIDYFNIPGTESECTAQKNSKKHHKKRKHPSFDDINDYSMEIKVENDVPNCSIIKKQKIHFLEIENKVLNNLNDITEKVIGIKVENCVSESAEMDHNTEKNSIKKHHKKKKHSKDCQTTLIDNLDNETERIMKIKIENDIRESIESNMHCDNYFLDAEREIDAQMPFKKRHKKKKHYHMDKEMVPSEKLDDIIGIAYKNQLDCLTTKKRHKKQNYFKDTQTELIGNFENESERIIKSENNIPDSTYIKMVCDNNFIDPEIEINSQIKPKKHKKKKHLYVDQEIIHPEKLGNVYENAAEIHLDCLTKKQHKKQRCYFEEQETFNENALREKLDHDIEQEKKQAEWSAFEKEAHHPSNSASTKKHKRKKHKA